MSAPPGSAAAVSDQLSLGTSQNHQGPGTGFLTSMKPPGTNQGVRAHVPVFVDRLHRFPQTLTSSYPWREPAGRPPAVLSGTPCPQTTARYSRQVWGVMVIAPHSTHLDSCVTSSTLALQPAFIWASSVQRQMPGLQGRVQKAGTAGLLSASRHYICFYLFGCARSSLWHVDQNIVWVNSLVVQGTWVLSLVRELLREP